jgi:hypothetical protein
MTIEQFYALVSDNREKLKNQIQQNIYRITGISLTHQIDDMLSEMIVEVIEKFDTLTFNTTSKTLNYISKATCQKFTDDARKDKSAKKKFHTELYIEEYLIGETDIEDAEISTSKLYKHFTDYIETKFGYEASGIYKTYTMNEDMNYDKLADITGYSRCKAGNFIKMIKDDLKLNKKMILNNIKR